MTTEIERFVMQGDELKTELETLAFYELGLARYCSKMSGAERAEFLARVFGRRANRVYDRLVSLHPESLA